MQMGRLRVSIWAVIALLFFVLSGNAQKPAVVTKEVTYKATGTTMKGYLAYPGGNTKKRPGIIVVPEWWGLNDYAKMRAHMLADLGYAAMAIDMYGGGKVATTADQAGQLSGSVLKNPELLKARFAAALRELASQPVVDTSKIGAIGYCFGGTVAIDAALMKFPLDAVVSFHGSLGGIITPPPGNVDTKILVCNGASDPVNPPNVVDAFKSKMDDTGVDYRFIDYPGAKHAFTNPANDPAMQGASSPYAYNKAADEKSWKDMQEFLSGVFGK
jgi:dienelactone hydrolase